MDLVYSSDMRRPRTATSGRLLEGLKDPNVWYPVPFQWLRHQTRRSSSGGAGPKGRAERDFAELRVFTETDGGYQANQRSQHRPATHLTGKSVGFRFYLSRDAGGRDL
jgi:hypothetical protein